MTKILVISGLLLFGAVPDYSQTRQSADSADNNGQVRHEHNWGWIGLLGLAGLAGIRNKKSEDVRRLESHGVKVSTV
jgi:MYXO-CTERM domain-containing protein